METGLYYLNARYYKPDWCRFISPDSATYLDPDNPNGLNLYAYCYNDPVNYCDPSGHFVISTAALILIGVGVAAGLGYAAYTDYIDDYNINGSVGWQTYVGSAMIGGAIGFGIGYFGPAISSFLGSSFSFTLPSLGALNTGGALAVAGGTAITITGAQIVNSALLCGLILMFSWGAERYAPKDGRSNYVQNEEFERICDEYGLNKTQRDRIHHRITKKGFSADKIRELIERLYPYTRR